MNDTSPLVEARFKQLMMERSGEERLSMGCSMFDAAKQIVRSSIVRKRPEISDREIKAEIFLRFYGAEFSDAAKGRILAALDDGRKA